LVALPQIKYGFQRAKIIFFLNKITASSFWWVDEHRAAQRLMLVVDRTFRLELGCTHESKRHSDTYIILGVKLFLPLRVYAPTPSTGFC
jgi:hypothetical protein